VVPGCAGFMYSVGRRRHLYMKVDTGLKPDASIRHQIRKVNLSSTGRGNPSQPRSWLHQRNDDDGWRRRCRRLYRCHLGCRCSAHLCRLNASSIAFEGRFGIGSSRWTKGCDHAQSEHLQFADSFVGPRIFRSVSCISQLYAHMRTESQSSGVHPRRLSNC
jgi:hypothetical protein